MSGSSRCLRRSRTSSRVSRTYGWTPATGAKTRAEAGWRRSWGGRWTSSNVHPKTCSRESSEVVGRAVEKRGCGGRLGETIAAARLPDPTSSLGGGAYLLLDRPQPSDEQGLREAHRDQRSVHLHRYEPPNGEEIGSLVRLFGQSLEKPSEKSSEARHRSLKNRRNGSKKLYFATRNH